MKITIYELLGMVKDGKAPKKIKVTGTIYYFDEEFNFYFTKTKKGNVALGGKLNEINLLYNFNNEYTVEILEEKEICHKCHKYPAEYNQTYCEFCLGISKLEEEKKIPEKLDIRQEKNIKNNWKWKVYGKEHSYNISTPQKIIADKLNDVIDYLKSKGE